MSEPYSPEVRKLLVRRRFIRRAAAGSVITAFGGGLWLLADSPSANAKTRADGRRRLPPGQRVIHSLKPMGGEPGPSARSKFRLRVHGAVKTPLELDFRALSKLPTVTQATDVHCVTGWTVLGASFVGVKIAELARRAGVEKGARYAIIEGAKGYTANVPIREIMKPNTLVSWQLEGKPLRRAHGAPVRALIPDLYFWKSAKWLTGIKFVRRDEPGYWETRGYHRRGDPWREERHG